MTKLLYCKILDETQSGISLKDLERACKRQSIIAVKVYHYNVFIINTFQQGQIVGKNEHDLLCLVRLRWAVSTFHKGGLNEV